MSLQPLRTLLASALIALFAVVSAAHVLQHAQSTPDEHAQPCAFCSHELAAAPVAPTVVAVATTLLSTPELTPLEPTLEAQHSPASARGPPGTRLSH